MHDTASINKVGTLATRPCGPRSHRSHRNINGHITRLQSPSHEVPVTPNESTTETSTSINMAHIWFRFHARPPRRARISLLPILSNPLTSTRYNDYLQLSPKSEWYVETNNGDLRSLAIFIFLCEVWVLLRPARREFSFSFLYLAGLFPQDTFSFTAIQIQQSSFGDDTCVNSDKLVQEYKLPRELNLILLQHF